MAKQQERLYTAVEGAHMTRLALSSFRTKVSKLGIRGQRDGQRMLYTHKQIEDIFNGVPGKKGRR